MTVFSAKEETQPVHVFTVTDSDGNAVQPTSITLTYYDRLTGTVINSRDAQDVLDANNVTVVNGLVTWTLQALDTTLHNGALVSEVHVALWQWVANSKADKHESIHRILNLTKV